MSLIYLLEFSAQSISYGFWLTTLILFFFSRKKHTDVQAWVEANNLLIALRSFCFGTAYLFSLFMAWYSQAVYEQDAFNYSGDHFWFLLSIQFTIEYLLPLIMLRKRVRRQLNSAILLLLIWLVDYIVLATCTAYKIHPSIYSLTTLCAILLIYVPLLLLFHWLCKRRKPE